MSQNSYHFIVEEGPDKGLEIVIPPEGARAGRSSNNDIVLRDPAMSRFHCRFFFKPDQGLWAEDLGSSNTTLLNESPLRESRVHPGDMIIMGDTTLKVVSDTPPALTHETLFDNKTEELKDAVDFGIIAPPVKKPRHGQRRLGILLTVATLMALLATVAWLMKQIQPQSARPHAASEPVVRSIEIIYEKVQAASDNIFRYDMEMKDNELSIQIDDIKNKRHVMKNQRKKIDAELAASLIDYIEHAGFFDLHEEYRGRSANVWEMMDLTITIGRRAHRVVVENRIEPDEFKNVRETIEEFGRNELGLAALALSHEKLMELSRNAWLLGQSLYDQRQVKNENLALAIRSLKEMEWYMETIEPKPEYYAAAIALMGESEREQQETYEHHLFLANRAVRLKEWSEAAAQLRTICEKIPDRTDDRHKSSRKKLIDVERRVKRER